MESSLLSYKLQSHIRLYTESHQAPVNKFLHFVGIPLLLVASLGLLSRISAAQGALPSILQPNAAWIVLLAASVWYMWQDWRSALLMILPILGCYAVGTMLTAEILGGLACVGIAAHMVGHYGFEGKPPSLLTRPVAILEAPAWLLSNLTRRRT